MLCAQKMHAGARRFAGYPLAFARTRRNAPIERRRGLERHQRPPFAEPQQETAVHLVRFLGGVLIVTGMVVMAWNLWHTAADARRNLITPIPVPIPEPVPHQVPAPLPAVG